MKAPRRSSGFHGSTRAGANSDRFLSVVKARKRKRYLVRDDLISALTQVYLMRFLFSLNSYEHVITGVRTADPPIETLGGILADDMGLGKTLTVLSTILRTARMSKSYAEENNEAIAASKYGRNDTHKIFSRATLVIVPSSRT